MRRTYQSKWKFLAFAALSLSIEPAIAAAQTQNPVDALKDTWNKAKSQQSQQKPGQPGKPSSSQKSQNPAQASGNTPARNDTGAFTPPAGTKVEATLLAPQEQGAQFSVSPHGVHMATQSHSGSRPVMIYDGVPGPKFDQIFVQGMSLAGAAFSPDGRRYAYCGQQGNEFAVILDSKELYRSGDSSSMSMINMNSCGLMNFTSNNKHFYFVVESKFDNSHDAFRFVFDGKASQQSAVLDLREFAFSPDGDHFAYVWSNPAARAAGSEKLIVDGKLSPFPGGAPQWTADSEHLFTTVRTGGAHPSVDIFLDGKPYLRADFARMFIPPVGNMNIAQVTKSAGVPTPSSFIVIGGKVVPGSEHPGGGGNNDLAFSEDGKHYAVRYTNPNSHQYLFVDGKRTQEYTRFDLFHSYGANSRQKYIDFTPAGAPVFVGFNGNSQFVNVGNQEWPQLMYMTELAISPAGNHVVASGLHQLQVDGKAVSMPDADRIYSLKFSSDGAHMAMAVQSRAGITVFLDGTPQTAFGAVVQDDSVFIFSPDGKHLAYICRSSNPAAGNDLGVCVDGKYVSVGANSPLGLTFSNDSNHLFWNKRTPRAGFRAYVDGNPVYDGFVPAVSGFAKENWQADGPNGLLFLSRDNTGFKRISVIPSDQSNLAAMVGGANAIPAAHSGN